jgi:hypothetical protein
MERPLLPVNALPWPMDRSIALYRRPIGGCQVISLRFSTAGKLRRSDLTPEN